jgi:hypothetical protein
VRTAQIDASELIDFRPANAPLALWGTMAVLNVHYDTTADVPMAWRVMAERLVYETLYALAADPSLMLIRNPDAWLLAFSSRC